MSRFENERERMVQTQIAARGVRGPAVLDAMRAVPRELFLPAHLTGVQLILPKDMILSDVAASVREVVAAELERLPEFRAALARGEYPVC